MGVGVCPGGSEPLLFLYTEAPRYAPEAVAQAGERFPGGARLHVVANRQDRLLVPEFAASADAAVSFDGQRVLFAGKEKPTDKWQIWEVALSDGAPRRVIACTDDCITPFYLPGDKIVYTRRIGRSFQLETSAGTRLTYGPGNPIVNDVLRDGRVLFESTGATNRDLFTVYTDGSGVETVRCDHIHDRRAGHELPSGDIVFETGGKLARFTSARAVEVPLEEQPDGVTLRRNQVQPVIVRARPRPKIHPSGLGDREGANTLCLSVYTSKLPIPEGVVANVRLWAQNDEGAAVAIGTAPVDADGSFFLTAPADRAVRFELLDKSGNSVASEKGWFWYKRGEQRICVGCHAGPEHAVENVQPQVLLRTTEPVNLNPVKWNKVDIQ